MKLVVRVLVAGLLVASEPRVWATSDDDETTSHGTSPEGASDTWPDQEATDSLKSFFSINPPRQQGGRSQWGPPPWARPADTRPNLPWHTAPRTTPPTTRRPPKYSLRTSPFHGTYPFESEVRGESYHSRIRFHHSGSNPKLNHPSRGQTFGNWGFSKPSNDGRHSHTHEHGSQHRKPLFDHSKDTGTSFRSPYEIHESLGGTGTALPNPRSTHQQQQGVRESTLETLPYPDDYSDTFPNTGVPQPTHTHSDNHENVQIPQHLPEQLHQSHENSGREPSFETNERTPHQDSQDAKPFLESDNLEEAKDDGSTSLDYLGVDEVIDGGAADEDSSGAPHHPATAAREHGPPKDEPDASSPVWSNDSGTLPLPDDYHDTADPSIAHASLEMSSVDTGLLDSPKAPKDIKHTDPSDYNSDYYDHLYDEFLDLYYDDPEQKQPQQQQHHQQQRKQQQDKHQEDQQHHQDNQQQDQPLQQHGEPTSPRFPPLLEVLQPAAGGISTIAASPPPPSPSSIPSSTFLQSTTTIPLITTTLDTISAPSSTPADTNTETSLATTTPSISASDNKQVTTEITTTTSTATTSTTPSTTTTTTSPKPATTTSPPHTTTTSRATTVPPITTPTTTTTSTSTTTTSTTTPFTTTKPQATTRGPRGGQRDGIRRAGAGRARGRAISLSEILQGLSLGLPQFLVALKTHGFTLKDFTSKVQNKGLTQEQFRKAKGNLETLIAFLKEGDEEEDEEDEELVEEVKTSETGKEEGIKNQSGEEQNQGRKVTNIPYWLTSRPTWRPPTTTTTTTTTTTPATTTTTTTPSTTTSTTSGPSHPPKIFGFRPGGRPQFSVGPRASNESISGEGDTGGEIDGVQEGGVGTKEGEPIPIKLDLGSVMREKGLSPSDILHDLGSLFTVADDDGDNSNQDAESGKETTEPIIVNPEDDDNTTTSTPATTPASSSTSSPVSLKPYIPPRKPQRSRPRPYRPQGGLLGGGSGRHIVTNRHQTSTRSTLFPPYVPPSTTPYTPSNTQQDDSEPEGTRSPKYNKDSNRHAFDDYHNEQPKPNITLNMTKSAIMAASVMGGTAMCVFLAILVVVMYRGRVRLRRRPLALASDSSTSSTPPLYVPRMRASMGKGQRQTAGFWGTLKKRFDPYSQTSSLSVIS